MMLVKTKSPEEKVGHTTTTTTAAATKEEGSQKKKSSFINLAMHNQIFYCCYHTKGSQKPSFINLSLHKQISLLRGPSSLVVGVRFIKPKKQHQLSIQANNQKRS
mmetsp:Transcript_32857/g.57147  ORF Transcript_32857/g.57147 Transcript_32857/m.57147 type:complete len:105 (-) Transcript_32857:571-885(-)